MRWLIGTLVAAVAVIGLYYGSAIHSLSGLVAAVRQGDGAEVVARTDLRRLSHSLSEQIVAAYLDRIGATRRIGPMERMLVGSYGSTVADALVDKMLTPENLTQLLVSGRFADARFAASTLPPLTDLLHTHLLQQLGRTHFINPVKIAIRVSKARGAEATEVILHRSSLSWKLAGINLPQSVLRQIAESLPAK